ELADGRLQLLSTNLKIAPLTFSASWLESPDTVAVELIADLAGKIAQSSGLVDGPAPARH
ncbi:MAG TPA: LysR family transcriptional regulator, partial [Bradyrhizobium sp.]